jgi:DNA-binding NarL/FixJ family response regulator
VTDDVDPDLSPAFAALTEASHRCGHLGTCASCRSVVVVLTATVTDLARSCPRCSRRFGAPPCPLTTRDLDVISAIADGLTIDDVGRRLHIAHATVRAHIRCSWERLGMPPGKTSRLVVLALRNGWIR